MGPRRRPEEGSGSSQRRTRGRHDRGGTARAAHAARVLADAFTEGGHAPPSPQPQPSSPLPHFIDAAAETRFHLSSSLTVQATRHISFATFSSHGIPLQDLFVTAGLDWLYTSARAVDFSPELVRQFYANRLLSVDEIDDTLTVTSRVNGIDIEITSDLLAEVLHLPHDGRLPRDVIMSDPEILARFLIQPPESHRVDFPVRQVMMTPLARVINIVLSWTVFVKKGGRDQPSAIHTRCIYAILGGIRMDWASILHSDIARTSVFGHTTELTRLFRHFRVPLSGFHVTPAGIFDDGTVHRMFATGEEGHPLSPRPRHPVPGAATSQPPSTTDPVVPPPTSGPIGRSTVTPLSTSPFTSTIPTAGAGTSTAAPGSTSAAHDLGTSLFAFIDSYLSSCLPPRSDQPPPSQPSRDYFKEQFAIMATSMTTLADLVSRRFESIQTRMDSLDAQMGSIRSQQAAIRSHQTLDRDTSESRFQYIIRTLESYFRSVGHQMEPYVPQPPSPQFTSSWSQQLAAILASELGSDAQETSAARSTHRAPDVDAADGSTPAQEHAGAHSADMDGVSAQDQPPAQTVQATPVQTPETTEPVQETTPVFQTPDVSIDVSIDSATHAALQAELAAIIEAPTPISQQPADDVAPDA